MGALEGRYLAGPARWNSQWDLTATARSPPAGLPWELSRRFERSERDADLPNTVYGRSAPARMSDIDPSSEHVLKLYLYTDRPPRTAGGSSLSRNFRKAIKSFAQNTVQKRVLLAYF